MASGTKTSAGMVAVIAMAATAGAAWLLLRADGAPGRGMEGPGTLPSPSPPTEPEGRGTEEPPSTVRPPMEGEGIPDAEPTVSGLVFLPDGAPAAGASVRMFAAAPPAGPAGGIAVRGIVEAAGPVHGSGGAPTLGDLFGPLTAEAVAASSRGEPPLPPPQDGGGVPLGTATTGEHGHFSFSPPGPGPFRVEATLEPHGRAVEDGIGPGGPPVLLRLGSATALRGVVRDGAGGAPVPGARIEVRARGSRRAAIAGEDGTFLVPDLPAGTCSLVARAAGRADVLLEGVPVAGGGSPVEVLFLPGFALRVTVCRGEDRPLRPGRQPPPPGPPMEGARVTALHGKTGSVVTAVTGPGGVALLSELAAGSWEVVAHAEDHGLGLRRSVTFSAGDPAEAALELRLAPLVRKTVRVLDAEGRPVAGARAFWSAEFGALDLERNEPAGTTDGRGEVLVAFDERIDRRSALWVVPVSGAAFLLSPEEPGTAGEEKVIIGPGRIVAGTVKDGTGSPVPGASVTLEVEDEAGARELLFLARTDVAGAYSFPGVPFGKLLVTVESESDFADAEREATVRDDPLVVDVRLEDPWGD